MSMEPATGVPLSTLPVDRPDETRSPALVTVLRDITRGGLAGLIVGIVLGGIGGRLVMRLAAVLVPDADGAITENGNVIGRITFEGTSLLIFFTGLFAGALVGAVWVVIRPWLPAGIGARAAVSVPIAIALGTSALIDDANVDFAVLAHDPVVVASLVALIGAFGPAVTTVDHWLDRQLPWPTSGRGVAAGAYWLVTAFGLLLTVTLVIPTFPQLGLAIPTIGLFVIGVATLASWWSRVRGAALPSVIPIVARVSLVIATIAGLAVTVREVSGALG